MLKQLLQARIEHILDELDELARDLERDFDGPNSGLVYTAAGCLRDIASDKGIAIGTRSGGDTDE